MLNKTAILGFSHIILEVSDLRRSLNFYNNLGFRTKFEISEKINLQKQKILFNKPSRVRLKYLKNTNSDTVGMEIMQHDKNLKKKIQSNFIFAFNTKYKETKYLKDPDGNLIILLSKKISGQHIFFLSSDINKTESFFKKKMSMEKFKAPSNVISITKKFLKKIKKIKSLKLKNALFNAWDLKVHLIATKKKFENKFLNQLGFSCLGAIVTNMNQIAKKNERLVGPFKITKIFFNKKQSSKICFLNDKNSIFIEYYLNKE